MGKASRVRMNKYMVLDLVVEFIEGKHDVHRINRGGEDRVVKYFQSSYSTL